MKTTLPLDPAELETAIGYTFNNKDLLRLALTHSSYSHENNPRSSHRDCNECLEFLGDSVLSLVASEELYTNYENLNEGELTRLRADAVCEKALARYAVQIGLGQYLLLGVGEEKSHGRERKSILADAFEALLAAIRIDAGENGIQTVRDFLLPYIKRELYDIANGGRCTDSKTLLQQFIQQSEGDFLVYAEVGESGPDHSKIFEVEARLNSNVIGRGTGRSKKEAEQNAAADALKLFGVSK